MSISVTVGEESIMAVGDTALQTLFLREQIADSMIWQAIAASPLAKWSEIVEATTPPTALNRSTALNAIVLERLDNAGVGDAVGSEKARCFIRPWDEEVSEWAATGSWDVSGMLLMTLEIPEPEEYRGDDMISLAMVDFWNKVDGIKNAIMNPGNNGYERIVSPVIRRVILPGLIDPRSNQNRRVRVASYSVKAEGAIG